MFRLHMVTSVACKQEQGGTRGEQNEVVKKRSPLQASEQVWTVLLLLVFSLRYEREPRESEIAFTVLTVSCRDAATRVEFLILSGVALCFLKL